jgi:hypothetical protein
MNSHKQLQLGRRSFVKNKGLDGIIITSDYLSLVRQIKSTERDHSTCGPVIQDIKTLERSFNYIFFRNGYHVLKYWAYT